MRVPLALDLETRGATVAKDSFMSNAYAERDGDKPVGMKRAGAALLGAVGSGAAQLAACWNGMKAVVGDAFLVITLPATVSSTTGLTPITAALPFTGESVGAAAATQSLLVKNSQQAWIYTP